MLRKPPDGLKTLSFLFTNVVSTSNVQISLQEYIGIWGWKLGGMSAVTQVVYIDFGLGKDNPIASVTGTGTVTQINTVNAGNGWRVGGIAGGATNIIFPEAYINKPIWTNRIGLYCAGTTLGLTIEMNFLFERESDVK